MTADVRAPATERTVSWPGAFVRSRLWRLVYALAGGLRVTGTRPVGPAVVVANHASHADTAALLAAVPSRGRPAFAAAADYWYDVPVRRLLVTSVAAALPVRRGDSGAYEALLAAARPHLAGGGVVVIYPEGTRSQDGQLGRFHSGALRLAHDTGVPLVAAAVVGTADVLPKHGRLHPAPVEVRFADALDGASLAAATAQSLRDTVQAMVAAGPARVRESAVWSLVARFVRSRTALAVAAAWGFAEALAWPVVAEMFLVLFAVAVPRRVIPSAVAVAAGSAVGVAAHVWVTAHGVHLPLPLVTPRMQDTAVADLRGGPAGIWHQAFSGIPVKVYADAAGSLGLGATFVVAAAVERFARILGVAALLAVASRVAGPWLRRLYGWYLVVVTLSFVVLLAMTVAAWS